MEIVQSTLPTKRSRAFLRLGVQLVGSACLISLLVWLAIRYNVSAKLRQISPSDLTLAGACIVGACGANTLRWLILLRGAGIKRSWGSLFLLYLIGLFFTNFLPTGTGGDAVRIFDVSRRSGKTAGAILATLQERLLGMGVSMCIGLGATLLYWARVPSGWRPWVILCQLGGALAVALLLYPHVWVGWFARSLGARQAENTHAAHPQGAGAQPVVSPSVATKSSLATRLMRLLAPILALNPLGLSRLLLAIGVTAAGVMLSIVPYQIIGHSLGFSVGFTGWLLVIPLVWVIKMAPITVGGIGVGEGAIAGLMAQLFGADRGTALAVAVAYTCLQFTVALLGGLLTAMRMLRGKWIPAAERSSSLEGQVLASAPMASVEARA